jgi:PAS domain S-box-containing protein
LGKEDGNRKRSVPPANDTGATAEEKSLLDVIPDGVCQLDARGVIVSANSPLHRMLKCPEGELVGKAISDIFACEGECGLLMLLSGGPGGEARTCEGLALCADGSRLAVQMDWDHIIRGGVEEEGFTCVLSDVTGRRETQERLKWELAVSGTLAELSAALVSSATTLADVANIVLDRAQALTDSGHGYVASIDLATGDLVAHTLTSMVEGECRVPDKRIVFPRGSDGRYSSLWGHSLNTKQAFYTNSPGTHGSSRGVPGGHIKIQNFLTAPAMFGETVVGQISLANSEGGYTDRDLETVKRLADLYALFINRVRTEQDIARLARFPAENPNPVLRVKGDGTILYDNRASAALLDMWHTETGGKLGDPWLFYVHRALEKGETLQIETRVLGRFFSLAYAPVPQAGYVNVYALDVTEHRRTEDFLRRERDFTSAILDTVGALVVVMDTDGRVVRFNRTCEDVTGHLQEEARGKLFWDLLGSGEDIPMMKSVFEDLRAGLFPRVLEHNIVAKNGARRLIAWRQTVLLGRDGLVEYVIATGLDITERRRFESYQTLATRLLEHLNQPQKGIEPLSQVTGIIKEFTGLEAVGIRLNEVDDFPYFVTEGFPASFIKAENYLCARARDGSLVLDENGNPVLECMCGNILAGRVDPSQQFFTSGGSFWTNSTTALLASSTDEDRGAHTRNNCNRQGYESVALIPIKADEEIIGLLQLNDTRRDRFTRVTIRFMEQIGANIGMALKRQRAEEALRELNETLEARVAERTVALERRATLLRAMASELTHAESRERRRLASVLHDHLQQLLVAAKLKVDMLTDTGDAAEVTKALSEASGLLQQAIDSSRSLAVDLSPPILYEAGLAPAVEWLAREMREKQGLTVTVEADESVGASEQTAVLLFNALRELLFNVVKHARTRSAQVTMSAHDEENLSITVSDDGVGFEAPSFAEIHEEPEGFGLLTIRERLEAAGGYLQIESGPGKGTRITMIAPRRARRRRGRE